MNTFAAWTAVTKGFCHNPTTQKACDLLIAGFLL